MNGSLSGSSIYAIFFKLRNKKEKKRKKERDGGREGGKDKEETFSQALRTKTRPLVALP